MRWSSAPAAFELPMVVLPEDIDEQQIANNVLILRWMLRAAVAHSVSLGFGGDEFAALGAMFVVRRHEVDYHRSARLGDRLLLRTWPVFMKAATAERRTEILRPADGAVIARGHHVWAWIGFDGRPQRMPDIVLAAFDPARYGVEPPTTSTGTTSSRGAGPQP